MNSSKIMLPAVLGGLLSTATLTGQQASQPPVQPVNIILDTDINHNADDVGDAAMMWAMAAQGEFNVLAIITSSTNDYSAACSQAIASYYGHPNIPIGANKSSVPGSYSGYFSYYTQQVAEQFGFPGKTRAYYPDAVTVYRQTLANAADQSVYIVASGYYHPLQDLLQSGPDSMSPLTGPQLVAQKVKRLIIVGGRFPDSFDNDHGNLSVDPDSASYVVANWPSELVWMPDDQVSDVITSPDPNADPNTNPIKLAYNLYCSNGLYCNNSTPGWTQAALLYVARGGVGTYFGIGGQDGSTVVWDGTTTIPGRSIWSQTPNRKNAYLTKITDAATLSAIINPLIRWIPPRTITPQPPVANPQSLSTPGVPIAITLTATDPQGASLTYTIASQPAHGALTGTAPNLTYTPAAGYIGSDSFTFWASNGYLQSTITTISINVTGTNQPPVANSQSVSSYGASVGITLTATDPNNDPLTYTVVSQPTHGSLSGTAPNVTYTPVLGYTGMDTFTFRANDGRADSNVATVTINIDANGPPYRVSVNAGGPALTDANGKAWQADTNFSGNTLTFSTASTVTANAGDPRLYQTERYASDSVPYSFSSLPNGTYSVNLHFAEIAGNCFQVGCRVFNVQVQGTTVLQNFDVFAAAGGANIGIARSTTAVVTNGTLTITAVAGQTPYPILSAIDFVLQVPNTPLFGSISGTVTRGGVPVIGAIVSYGTETAITDSFGSYLFTRLVPGSYSFTAAPAIGLPVTQPVSVTGGSTTTANFALPAIQPPVANSQSVTAAAAAVPITLTASDPQGAALTYTVGTQPSHGTLSGTAPTLTYTSTTGYVGSDSFTFTASNGVLSSNTATVSITVTTPNHPPVANSQSVNSYGNSVDVTLTATDADNDPLTYAIVAQPAHGSLSGTAPNVTYTPVLSYTGTDTFTFLANDGKVDSNIATVTVNVDANAAPYRMRINAGGPSFTDVNGKVWQADTGSTGFTLTFSTTSPISSITGDPILYQTERYADATLQYSFSNLPNGTYTVNLHFAEIDGCLLVGCRVFNVQVQGTTVLQNFDVFAAAGGGNIGIARSTTAVVTNGTLTIAAVASQAPFPILSGIDFVLQVPNSPLFGSISGTVAGGGVPVVGATVSYGTETAITDSNGNYLFTRLAPGAYSLTATAASAAPVTQPVNVTGGSTTTANFALPAMQPPVANSQSVTTAGGALPITLTASDAQGAPLTYTVATQPSHGTLSGTAPALTYTPTTGYVGSDSFTFTASNGVLSSNTATVSISVTTGNHPPVANSQSVNSYGNSVDVTLTATDADNDPLTYAIVAQPAHGSLSGTAPNVTYTPVLSYTGTDTFTFRANDGQVDSNIATVTVNVDANAPPYRTRINAGGPSITDSNGNVWQADTGYTGFTLTLDTTSPITAPTGDPQLYQTQRYASDTLQYSFSNLPNGTYTVNLHFAEIDGCLRVGCRVFNVQVQGTTVLQDFDVFAAAGGGNIGIARSTTAVVTNGTLTIAAVASQTQFPILNAIDFVLQVPNSPQFGSISGTVTQAGTPVAGATVAYGTDLAITDTNGNFLFTRVPAGAYSLTAAYPSYGTATQTVNLSGGSTSTVTFSLTAITQPPVANPQSITTAGMSVPVVLTASDPQSAPLTYTVATQPSHGTLSGTAPTLTYTPTVGYIGSDSFTFTASNGTFQSNIATISITVTAAANRPPVANDQSVTSTNGAISITLTATDPDSDPLTYAVLTQPSHGSLSGTAPNLTYTPVAGYSGSDSFTFRANDGKVDSNTATVTISVTAVNRPPVANNQSVSSTNGATSITLTATDPDNDPLTYTVLTQPSHGSLSGTAPNLTYTPVAGYSGSDSFTFRANDGKVNSNTATVTISVTAPPTLTSITPNGGSRNTTVAVTLTGTNLLTTSAITVTPATDVTVSGLTVVNNTTVTANFTISSTAATGARNVTVTTLGGVSGSVSFTITAGPSLTSINPNTGIRGTAVPVTLTGANLTGATAIRVSGTGITVSGLTVVSSTSVTATFTIAPTATTGLRTVNVTTPLGTTNNMGFTVQAPSLSSISPNSGFRGQAVPVTLTGAGLTGATAVTVSGAGITVGSLTVVNDTTITTTFTIALTAALTARNVTATTPNGTTNAITFTVLGPTLTSTAPTSGMRGTTVPVTLTGTNLTGATGIIVSGAGVTVSNMVVVSATQVTATFAIALTAGLTTRNVTITTTAGTSNAVTFAVQGPTLTSIAPTSGMRGATVPVTLTGTNLTDATGITVSGSGVTVSTPTVVSATQVTANFTIALTAGLTTRNVTITTAAGTSNSVTFAVQGATLTSISPTLGAHGTSVNVTLTGTNLTGASAITVVGGGVTVSNLAVVGPNTVTATFAISSTASRTARNVTVTTPQGTTNAVSFTVN